MTADGSPVGTCFQLSPGRLVTAWHVVNQLGGDSSGTTVYVDALAGGIGSFTAWVERCDPLHDLAVLGTDGVLPASTGPLAATDRVPQRTAVIVTGVVDVDDPAHNYEFLAATGEWAGPTTRDGRIRMGRLRCRDVVPGMSGAPVLRESDGAVIGVVSARYNSADGWLRDSVWVARTELLQPLIGSAETAREEEALPDIRIPREVETFLTESINDTEYLVFGSPHWNGRGRALRLRDVWIPPNAAVRAVGRDEYWRPGGTRLPAHGESVQIDALLRSTDGAMVIGRPGYGKSTLCARLTNMYARSAVRDRQGWIPVRVPLRVVNEGGVWTSMEDLLGRLPLVRNSAQLRGQVSALAGRLTEAAGLGQLWFFLDGLEDVAEQHLPGLRRLLGEYAELSHNRLTVTCRRADHDAAHPDRRIPDLPLFELDSFSEDKLDLYIDQWHTHAEPAELRARAAINQTRLLLDAHEDLRELGRIPLLAAVICLVESQPRQARLGRASLMRRAVECLLREPAWRDVRHDQVDPEVLTELAQCLAFDLCAGTVSDTADTALVSRTRLRHVLAEMLVALGEIEADDAQGLDFACSAYWHRLVGSASTGLIQERDVGRYEFVHRSFQEYLAAEYVLRHCEPTRRLQLARDPRWREVFVHVVSIVQVTGQGTGDLLMLLKQLLREADSAPTARCGAADPVVRAESACAAAELLAEFSAEAIGKLGLERAATDPETGRPDGPEFSGLWSYARRIVSALAGDAGLDRALRLRCWCAAGRLERRRDAPALDLVPIAGGRGRVGTAEPLPMREAKRVPSSPQVEVQVASFEIARHPVTNLEFAAFIADRGYATPRWWTGDEAAAWRARDPDFLAELVELWETQRDLNFVKEFSEPEFARYAAAESRHVAHRIMVRDHPLYWHDSRFTIASAPVVGVNLWEAQAYCRWLQHRLRLSGALGVDDEVRLPTEVEWEWAAARGKPPGTPRAYPWGEAYDTRECVVRDFDSAAEPAIITFGAVPVGFVGHGRTPAGPEEMAGNVWEWTSSASYPWLDLRDRERPPALTKRIVRGGSWYSRERWATHVSFRLDDPPCNAYWDLGFRILVRRDAGCPP
ncbi:SUMF1/EgtB/PvdO family nonheme iron enzyme [Nocardia sp. NPDC127579]|uniref:SUMF1/EgtB/PvdO family nonheme iron enzyme n=1 Tax=Nocardia sp. NPDC127579 TaxID=3345402 RepID=UPI00364562AA